MHPFPHCCLWFLVAVLSLATSTRADCSRKTGGQAPVGEARHDGDGQASQPQAPGIEPTKHFIQTTFIYRDADESDQRYSQLAVERLQSVIRTLRDKARLTVDNENIDCGAQNLHRCGEFPLESPFHFLVVEDSAHGAAVYSIDRERNGERTGAIEAAILDALSRHSVYPLTNFASADSSSQVGFVRRLAVRELEEFARQNTLVKRSRKSSPLFSLHSPFELHLLNKWIVELRVPPHPLQPRSLNILSGGELTELIDDSGSSTVFVLFWTDVNSVSTHVFELWSRVSDERAGDGAQLVQLCSVACHHEVDTCRAFAISHDQPHVIYAFKEGRRVATQLGFGDVVFYSQWIDRVIWGSPRRLGRVEELERAQAGEVGGKGTSPAVTVAKFASEDDAGLTVYRRVASMLVGRYDLVYLIDDRSDSTTLSTYRPLELVGSERVRHFVGSCDYKSLLDHITHSSLPSVLDIGRGFTSDYLRGVADKRLLLLIHNDAEGTVRQKFHEMASRNGDKWKFAEINTNSAVKLGQVFDQLDLSDDEVPLICSVEQAEIRCTKRLSENGEKLTDLLTDTKLMTHAVELDTKKPHPLAYIQLARIDDLFGHQEIEMLPEPVVTGDTAESHHSHHHNFEGLDTAAMSGCPMMAHLNHVRDEL